MKTPSAQSVTSALSSIGGALGFRPGEGRRSALLFVHLLLASSVFILGRTVRDTLFLSRYSLKALPWMFVLYGVASSITAIVYSRVADKVARHTAIGGLVALGVTTYLGVWVAVQANLSIVYPVFYVWSEVVANLLIVQFWTLANDLNDARSAKRLFPVIGSARVLGVVLIGTSTGAIVRLIGTPQLLFVLAGLMVLIALLAFALRNEPRAEASSTARHGKPPSVLGDGYVRALALLILLTFAALTVGDYQFKAIARATYKEDALAQFFSLFYAVTGVVSFVFQVFVTPRLLGRLGVGTGMSVMPGVFGVASVLLPMVPHLGVATVMKFADNGFQYTIHDTTLQALYVPFPAAVKARTRALLDAAIKPLSYGLGGVLLLVAAPRLEVTQLSAVTGALVLVWLALIPVVKGRYQKSLQATLSARGALALDSEFVLDAAGKNELLSLLEKGEPRGVMLALEQLSDERSPQITRALERLLSSDEIGVRVEALRRLEKAESPEAGPIEPCLSDPSPAVRSAAMRAYAAVAGDEANERLIAATADEDRDVRISATVGLLLHGGIEGDIEGGARLSKLLLSSDRDERIEAAQVLGAMGREAYRPTRRLLQDDDPGVRRAALRACAGVPDPRLVPDLIALLSDGAVMVRAGAALVSIGEPSVPALLSLLADPKTDRQVRLHLPRLLRGIATMATYEALKQHVDVEDSHLRLRVFAALSRMRESLNAPPESLSFVKRLIEREINDEYRKAAAWEKAKAELSSPLLGEALDFRWKRAVRRVLRVLELCYAPGPLRLVRERLDDPKRKANALEVLDSLLAPSLRPLVMLFLDDTPLAQRLEKGTVAVPKMLTAEELLRAECAHPNPFVALVALDVIQRSKPAVGRELAEKALSHADPLVREAAIGALCACDASGARGRVKALEADPDPVVARSASLALARLDGAPQPEVAMFSTIEKILFLKSTQIFQKVASEDLAAVARVAQVESYHPGEKVVSEGEMGDKLYVLVRGRVEISVAGQKKASIGAGEAFGEMAVLDAAPRSATVTAVEETEVLSIGSEEFYEILHEQVEIAEGVIRMLTRRLRDLLARQDAPTAEAK